MQCSVHVYADLCSLLAMTRQLSILIGQNMQLTGCHNDNEMHNATCADPQISIECPYCSFPILCFSSKHGMYYSAYQYVTKDQYFQISEGYPELSNPPATEASTMAKIGMHNAYMHLW